MANLVGTRGTFVFEYGNRPKIIVHYLFCAFVKDLEVYRVRIRVGRTYRDSREIHVGGSVTLRYLRDSCAELADEYAAR